MAPNRLPGQYTAAAGPSAIENWAWGFCTSSLQPAAHLDKVAGCDIGGPQGNLLLQHLCGAVLQKGAVAQDLQQRIPSQLKAPAGSRCQGEQNCLTILAAAPESGNRRHTQIDTMCTISHLPAAGATTSSEPQKHQGPYGKLPAGCAVGQGWVRLVTEHPGACTRHHQDNVGGALFAGSSAGAPFKHSIVPATLTCAGPCQSPRAPCPPAPSHSTPPPGGQPWQTPAGNRMFRVWHHWDRQVHPRRVCLTKPRQARAQQTHVEGPQSG